MAMSSLQRLQYRQSSTENLRSRGKYLLETGLWSDCQLIVGEEHNQEIFKLHKLYLASASPFFEIKFFGQVDKGNKVFIPNHTPDTVMDFLRYIYYEKIDLTSFLQACNLYSVADEYLMLHLKTKCAEYIISISRINNLCKTYEFAKLHNDCIIMEACLKIIRTQTEIILCDDSFKGVNMDFILTIFEQDKLNISSEMELFNFLQRFVKYIKDMDSEDYCNGTTDKTKLDMKKVKEALGKIRFLTMDSQQFADMACDKNLLITESEQLAILKKLVSPNNPAIQMPSGFSTSKFMRID